MDATEASSYVCLDGRGIDRCHRDQLQRIVAIGPEGQRCPADAISAAIRVILIATCEIEAPVHDVKDANAKALGAKGASSCVMG